MRECTDHEGVAGGRRPGEGSEGLGKNFTGEQA